MGFAEVFIHPFRGYIIGSDPSPFVLLDGRPIESKYHPLSEGTPVASHRNDFTVMPFRQDKHIQRLHAKQNAASILAANSFWHSSQAS